MTERMSDSAIKIIKMKRKPFRTRFKRYFLTGLVVLVPIMGTLFLITWAFTIVTNRGFDLLNEWPYFKNLYLMNKTTYAVIGRLIVLLGLAGIVLLTGFIARNFIGRRVFRLLERIIENIPVVNRIYIAFRQISTAFISSSRGLFSYVVLVEYPRKGIYSIGFVMSEAKGEVQAKTKDEVLSIFIPTTPNPTSGMFVMIPRNDTVRLEMNVEDAIKMVISGGAVVPPYFPGEISGIKEQKIKEGANNDEDDQ